MTTELSMRLQRPAAEAFFTVERRGDQRILVVTLSSSEGGDPLWIFPIQSATHEECRDALKKFLDDTLEQNVSPVFDDKVLQAPELFELGFGVVDAVLDGVQSANAPLVTWAEVALRLDRLRYQFQHIEYLFQEGRIQSGG